jgi:hypothetical protein
MNEPRARLVDVAASPTAVTFVTTEHFTLQGARAATIAESTGRATMYLASVSGGLVGLGLVATASRVGTAFYAFGLVVLPTLAFIGVVTHERVLQSGIEDYGYARRIARLRGYYFQCAPELEPYILSVPHEERLQIQGLWAGRWQRYRSIAGMVAIITAVLAGSAASLLAAVADGHSLPATVAAGVTAALGSAAVLMRYHQAAWEAADSPAYLSAEETYLRDVVNAVEQPAPANLSTSAGDPPA